MATVKLRFTPYVGTQSQWLEIDATVRGDLAIHRPAYLRPEREGGGLSFVANRWQVSHIPSGDSVMIATPDRYWSRDGFTGNKRDLVAWAEAFQLAAPAFFAAARIGDQDAMRALVHEARQIGKGL